MNDEAMVASVRFFAAGKNGPDIGISPVAPIPVPVPAATGFFVYCSLIDCSLIAYPLPHESEIAPLPDSFPVKISSAHTQSILR